jgi:NAD(P)H-dependent FMN reductase
MMKDKPIGLIGIASGILGATKSLEQLRIVFSHIGSVVLPRVASLPEVEKKFDDFGNCIDHETEKEIKQAAKNLSEFVNLIKKQ